MMKAIKLLCCLAVFTVLSGCATFMRGSLESTPDPTYPFSNLDTPILVMASPESANQLQSKYYVQRVVSALRMRGYNEVVAEQDKAKLKSPARLEFWVDVSSKTQSFVYRSADYGTVQTGVATSCDTYEGRHSAATRCVTAPTTGYGVIGYSDKTGYSTTRQFILNAVDLKERRKVLQLQATSGNSGCNEIADFDFLAEQALERMNFYQIVKQNFTVKMPKDYQCD